MSRFLLSFVPGVALASAALRRHGDLGDTVSALWFWLLVAVGLVLLGLAAPRGAGREVDRVTGSSPSWPAAIASAWIVATPSELAFVTAILAAVWFALRLGAPGPRRGALSSAAEWVLAVWLALVAAAWFVDTISLLRLRFPLGAAPFLVTANNVGLVPHLTIALAVIGWRVFAAASPALPNWRRALGYLPTALLLRFLLLIGSGIMLEKAAAGDDHHIRLAAILDWRLGLALDLVAGLAAGALWFRGASSTAFVPGARKQSMLIPATLAVVVGLSWSADRILDATGRTASGRPPRIAVEERHSRWQSSDIHMTQDHYGQESGHDCRGLFDWLEGHYGPVRRIYDPTGDAALADVDVLVVNTPTQAFSSDELAALDRFVQRGGGLVLIGAHHDVHGTSEVLNSIAAPLGFRFVDDCWLDQRGRSELCYRKEPHVANHPTLAGLDELLFEVSCTIDIDSPRVRPILVGRSLRSRPLDDLVENHDGNPRDRSEQQCGQFPLLVVANCGAGRVAAIADSRLFSTSSVFMPGHREVAEGMIDYVAGCDVGAGWRDLLRRLGAALTAVLFFLALPGRGAALLVTCSLLAWGGSSIATLVAERACGVARPDLRAANALHDIKFVAEVEAVDWPTRGSVEDPSRAYSLFFQLASRVGAFPRLLKRFEEALASPGPVIWIDPMPAQPSAVAARLVEFALDGGCVVLIEREPRELVDAVGQQVALQLVGSGSTTAAEVIVSRFGEICGPEAMDAGRGIVGGKPMLRVRDGDRRCVATLQPVGGGSIVVLTCGAKFTDLAYGGRHDSIPDATMRRRYEVEFELLRAALAVRHRSR